MAILKDTLVQGDLVTTGNIRGDELSATNIAVSKGVANVGAQVSITKSDTGTSMFVGVGSGGTNHGVYSTTLDKWMVYADSANVYLNGNAETASTLSATLGVGKGGTGKSSVTKNAILAGNASSTTGALAAIATASGALYATAANGTATFGTLPVAQGGTGATSAAGALTNLGAAAASHTHAASDITGTLGTAHGGTGNTSVDTAPTSGSTKMVTSGGLYTTFSNKLGRTTNVSAADTNYTTYMVRGAALVASETTPTNNGQIAWVYE